MTGPLQGESAVATVADGPRVNGSAQKCGRPKPGALWFSGGRRWETTGVSYEWHQRHHRFILHLPGYRDGGGPSWWRAIPVPGPCHDQRVVLVPGLSPHCWRQLGAVERRPGDPGPESLLAPAKDDPRLARFTASGDAQVDAAAEVGVGSALGDERLGSRDRLTVADGDYGPACYGAVDETSAATAVSPAAGRVAGRKVILRYVVTCPLTGTCCR